MFICHFSSLAANVGFKKYVLSYFYTVESKPMRKYNVLKNIIGVFAGIMVAGLFAGIIQRIGHFVFPLDVHESVGNAKAMENYIKDAPIVALLIVPISYIIASFMGGLVTSIFIRSIRWKLLILIPGAFTILGAIFSLVQVPHPFWLMLLMLLPPLPVAYFGGSYLGEKNNRLN